MALTSSKISAKGQVVIPKEFRKRLGIKAGDKIRFRLIKEGILITPIKEKKETKDWREWVGALKGPGKSIIDSLLEEHKKERKKYEKRIK
ncbi:MAG: AbrB/MazE/SpoVT family DNA-binding domain-containing protein [Candidatus Aminicenantia bacterium]